MVFTTAPPCNPYQDRYRQEGHYQFVFERQLPRQRHSQLVMNELGCYHRPSPALTALSIRSAPSPAISDTPTTTPAVCQAVGSAGAGIKEDCI